LPGRSRQGLIGWRDTAIGGGASAPPAPRKGARPLVVAALREREGLPQSKSVLWPHSAGVRTRVTRAGSGYGPAPVSSTKKADGCAQRWEEEAATADLDSLALADRCVRGRRRRRRGDHRSNLAAHWFGARGRVGPPETVFPPAVRQAPRPISASTTRAIQYPACRVADQPSLV
jgi:hypothetical protein